MIIFLRASRDWGFVLRWDGATGGQGSLRRFVKAPRIILLVIQGFWKEFDLEILLAFSLEMFEFVSVLGL